MLTFAPHKLQLKAVAEPQKDEFGNSIPTTDAETWIDAGDCRCDDNGAALSVSINGAMYNFSHCIVCETEQKIESDDEIRILDPDDTVRVIGKVLKTSRCNHFSYMKIWI